MIYYDFQDTKVGKIKIFANDDALLFLCMGSEFSHDIPDAEHKRTKLIARAFEELDEYFNGERKEFDIPLEFHGTNFKMQVLRFLRTVKFGQVISYGELAKKIHRVNAARSVGNTLATNPLPIFIPCHRVITSDKTIGGFSCGIEIKKFLLELEGVKTSM